MIRYKNRHNALISKSSGLPASCHFLPYCGFRHSALFAAVALTNCVFTVSGVSLSYQTFKTA